MMPGLFAGLTSAWRTSSQAEIRPRAIAAVLGGTWSLGCLAVGVWMVQRYFATLDTACPPAADLAAFCRAHMSDALGTKLAGVSRAFLAGLVLTGAAVALISLTGGSRCSSCGAGTRIEATACRRCGFDPFA